MNLIIHNTSVYDSDLIRKLAHFAYLEVLKKAKRQGWDEKLTTNRIFLNVTNSIYRYCGRYMNTCRAWWLRSYRFKDCDALKRCKDEERLQHVLVRIGSDQKLWPCKTVYPRYKGMPEGHHADWLESFVGTCAHEFCHCHADGNKSGETFCELTELEVLEDFRKVKQTFVVSGEATEETKPLPAVAEPPQRSVMATKHKVELDVKKSHDIMRQIEAYCEANPGTIQKLAGLMSKKLNRTLFRQQVETWIKSNGERQPRFGLGLVLVEAFEEISCTKIHFT